jgi:hypothetical protein
MENLKQCTDENAPKSRNMVVTGDMSKVQAECKGFKCAPPLETGGMQNHCCWCVLYNQPNFTNVKSLLEVSF